MPTSTQQQAKSMSQQWQEMTDSFNQSKSSDSNQNFIANSTSQAYQQQKNDYNQQYDKQLNDQYLWAQNKQSIKSTDDSINRTTQNNQQALQLQQRQSEVAQANSTKTVSGGSDAFGIGAARPSGYNMNMYGQKTAVSGSQLADWQDRQDSAMNSIKQGSEANAAGDVLRTQANTTAQETLARSQAALDAQKQSQQNNFQSQEAAKDRASQERLRILQGYSVSPNSFRYW